MVGRASPLSDMMMDGYADDLAAVIEALDLKDASIVGHSTGGGEVARYIGRHGTRRGQQSSSHRRSAADHAKICGQSRGIADRGIRQPAERHDYH